MIDVICPSINTVKFHLTLLRLWDHLNAFTWMSLDLIIKIHDSFDLTLLRLWDHLNAFTWISLDLIIKLHDSFDFVITS